MLSGVKKMHVPTGGCRWSFSALKEQPIPAADEPNYHDSSGVASGKEYIDLAFFWGALIRNLLEGSSL